MPNSPEPMRFATLTFTKHRKLARLDIFATILGKRTCIHAGLGSVEAATKALESAGYTVHGWKLAPQTPGLISALYRTRITEAA